MNKNEINVKVNKVREVVNGVSNNDIILALHSFDFDVEKTIQAFCEDGASGVLDDWVRPAGSSSKKNKNKKKKASESTAAAAPAKPTPSVQVASVPSASPAPVAASTPKVPAQSNSVSSSNRVANDNTAQAPPAALNSVQEAFQALRNAISEREKVLLAAYNKNSSFHGDINQLIAQIRTFGSVNGSNQKAADVNQKAASPVQIKHATSQSSISSSVGADSGVNLSPTHQEDKKTTKKAPVAQVAGGGIQMSSDGLSADQLAAIQKTLQATLAANGIDASVLSGVTNGDLPARKQQQRKPQDRKKEGGKARPQLSILNNA